MEWNDKVEKSLDPGGTTVSFSAIRIVRSTSAIESGFIAAGVTISIIAALQCIIIALHWLGVG